MKKLFNIFCAGLACCGAVTAVISCSDDTYDPDPEKNWAGTTETFVPTDEKGFGTYYTPAIGRCGDPMPFFDRKAPPAAPFITKVTASITSTTRATTSCWPTERS